MISKLELQSVIEKYHLNGLIENVKWEVDKNKQLTINFMSPTREMLGRVVYNGFHYLNLLLVLIILLNLISC